MDIPAKHCGSCGVQLTSDSIFCTECGARQDSVGKTGQIQQAPQPQQPYQQAPQQQYQQKYQQPYQQHQYQQNYQQPNSPNQYYSTPKKKSSAVGVIAAILVVALVFAGGYYSYDKFLKGKIPALDKIITIVSQQTSVFGQESLKGLSETDIAEIMSLRAEGLVGTWEGTLTILKIQGLENDPDMTEENKKQMQKMLNKPMKLVFYFKGNNTDGFTGTGTISYPKRGDSDIEEMPFSIAAGKFNMAIQESDADISFDGDLTKKDGSLHLKGIFKISITGSKKQYIKGEWEAKQASASIPAE